jgi:hypothetical protein
MVTVWRWLLAAAAIPLVLDGCTSMAAGPAAGTSTAVSASVASGGHQGLSAVRHVWVIELENQGYAQSFGTPSADPYLAEALPRMGALLENYYAIGHSSADKLHRAGLRAGPHPGHPGRLPALDPFPRSCRGRAVSPDPRRGLRLSGGGPHARQPAVGRRAQLDGVPAGHGQ